MLFDMSDSSINLEGEWLDRSVNVLISNSFPTKNINLVISRDNLKEGVSFNNHIDDVRKQFMANLNKLKIIVDDGGPLNEKPSHFFEFKWQDKEKNIHQAILIVCENDFIMSITCTALQVMDEETRKSLFKIMRSFNFKK